MGIECFRVQFPKGMDANEYALKTQPAAKSSGRAAEQRGMAGQRQAAHVDGDRTGAADAGARVEEPEARADERSSNRRTKPPKKKPNPQLKKKCNRSANSPIAGESVFPLAAASDVVHQEEPAARPMPLAAPAEPQVKIEAKRSR